jgi:hypothetical protein
MIVDTTRSSPKAMPGLDVLIVGSGPVGLILARALDVRGMRVLILEAGPRETAVPRTEHCDAVQDGDVLDSVANARTRQVGGGLNLWGGQLGLLEPIDVEDADRWPLRHSEVYQHLDEALGILGLKGHDANERLRASFMRPPSMAKPHNDNLRFIETAWLPRPKFDRKFWQWLEASKSCLLWHNAVCHGVESAFEASPRVTVAIGGTQSRMVVNARFIVLTAGTLENARLLMLPTSSSETQPWKQNKWLGRGFTDHLDASVGRLLIKDRKRLARVFDPYMRGGVKYLPKIVWNDRKATSTGLGACGLPTYSLTAGQMLHDAGLLFRNIVQQPSTSSVAQLPRAVLSSARTMAPLAARYIASRRIGRPGNSDVHFRVSVEQRTRWQSGIRLCERDNDRDGLPRCILTWQRGDVELQAMGEFAEAADRWFMEHGLGRIEVEPSLTARAHEFWDQVSSGLHHAGTTRMGRSDLEGVVDPQLRVHGARDVFVCGASVFPSSGYINPTLTAMTLAVRLAENLTSLRNSA